MMTVCHRAEPLRIDAARQVAQAGRIRLDVEIKSPERPAGLIISVSAAETIGGDVT
jgi:hypothetical protein